MIAPARPGERLLLAMGRRLRRHQPPSIWWDTALAVLLFSASRFALVRGDDLSRWLLDRRLLGEAIAANFADDLAALAAVASVAGFLGAWLIAAWGGFFLSLAVLAVGCGCYRWPAARGVATVLDRTFAPLSLRNPEPLADAAQSSQTIRGQSHVLAYAPSFLLAGTMLYAGVLAWKYGFFLLALVLVAPGVMVMHAAGIGRTLAPLWAAAFRMSSSVIRIAGLVGGTIWSALVFPWRVARRGLSLTSGLAIRVVAVVALAIGGTGKLCWASIARVVLSLWRVTHSAYRIVFEWVSVPLRHVRSALIVLAITVAGAALRALHGLTGMASIAFAVVVRAVRRATFTILLVLAVPFRNARRLVWLTASVLVRVLHVAVDSVASASRVVLRWGLRCYDLFLLPLRFLMAGLIVVAGAGARAVALVGRGVAAAATTALGWVWLGIRLVIFVVALPMRYGARLVWLGVSEIGGGLWFAASALGRGLWLGISTLGRTVLAGVTTLATAWYATLRWLLLTGGPTLFFPIRYIGVGIGAIADLTSILGRLVARRVQREAHELLAVMGPPPDFVSRPIWLCAVAVVLMLVALSSPFRAVFAAFLVAPQLLGLGASGQVHNWEAPRMIDFGMTQQRLLAVIWTVFIGGAAAIGAFVWLREPEPVVVTHWANIYMMEKNLLPNFAKEFNAANHRVRSGRRIEVRPVLVNSGVIRNELVSLGTVGKLSGQCNQGLGGCPKDLDLPTMVTPAAHHWLPQVNHEAGRMIVDTENSRLLAQSYVGIIMQREMARCLGWPTNEVGIADVVALSQDPRGWSTCPTAKTEWGRQPLISFTDPESSSTARSMLFSLYAIGAGIPADQLTASVVQDRKALEYVRSFQSVVDHYVPDTVILASKMYEGPRFGHFFFMIESQLIGLYQGRQAVTVLGETKPRPLQQDLIFVYPKEGAIAYRQTASAVRGEWVDAEQVEAGQRWIDYLLEGARQRVVVENGFRPATNIPFADVINPRYGVDPTKPIQIIDPDKVDPAAGLAMANSWGEVKKPGIAAFVVDTSGSMRGAKMEETKKGLLSALDNMAVRNLVGLVTFADQVNGEVPIGPLGENRYAVAEAVDRMQASGQTALYDGVIAGIRMVDAVAPGLDAIRGVVVLTDGKANLGAPLDDVIRLISREELPITRCRGFESESTCVDERERTIPKGDLIGVGLAMQTEHPVHIFFVGVGDADLEIGRLLAEATGSAYRAATEKDLATVLETFGRYF